MKLIVDMQDFVYNHIKEFNSTQLYELNVVAAIKNGIPLEDELEKIKQEITRWCNGYLQEEIGKDINKIIDKNIAEPKEELESQKIGHWIPVSERLPEFGQDVLLSLRSLDIKTGFRAKSEPYFYCHGVDGCYIEPQNVLAWMPLPEPMKVGEE